MELLITFFNCGYTTITVVVHGQGRKTVTKTSNKGNKQTNKGFLEQRFHNHRALLTMAAGG